MMRKTIWLVDQYASPPQIGVGGGGRHYYLGKELVKKKFNVYVISANYSHLLSNKKLTDKPLTIENIDGINWVWIDVPKYKSSRDKQRVFNWFIFVMKVIRYHKYLEIPNVVLTSSPSPFSYFIGKKIANLYNAKFIFEIRDIWPLTLIEIGGISKFHPLIKLMSWVERKAYKNSDVVLSNLPLVSEHIKTINSSYANKFQWITNGFSKAEMDDCIPLEENKILNLPENSFVVGYTGTLGLANALTYLIDAAKLMQNDKDIYFVLVGRGEEKDKLKQKVIDLELSNVIFIDPIKKSQVKSMLEMFDVCFIGWKNDKMYRFGISPNKLPEYMYSGKPVIHSYSGEGDMIKMANAGITVEAENPQQISQAIYELKSLEVSERHKLGLNGISYALKNLEYASLANKLKNIITEE